MKSAAATYLQEQFVEYVGGPVDTALAKSHLVAVEQSVRAYTRDKGFDDMGYPDDDIAVVILSAAARSYSNPTHTKSETVGPFQHAPGSFTGWTLPELAILNRHRKRAH